MNRILHALCQALTAAGFWAVASSTASEPNLALFATPSTSFVSPREKLDSINDGFGPGGVNDKSRGCYGNFPRKGTNRVELAWSRPVCTRKADVC